MTIFINDFYDHESWELNDPLSRRHKELLQSLENKYLDGIGLSQYNRNMNLNDFEVPLFDWVNHVIVGFAVVSMGTYT